ncbi:hypothetical protein BCR35DRAFT_311008 [Leucosporidium creatinivorum]|uniref:Uncharacterized protein n=1 Tax=Leucosporidium creatinivorum TaxID=106004 RepID=A0A1Y2CI44_9BASI|nr:hypothetical protein BCR35DRAFT_311008 [Leucosporidium creatinivorum]
MPTFFMHSITAMRALYAIQTVILLSAIAIRWKRTPNDSDLWIFRTVSTPQGTFLVPHFAVAWQASTLVFCILLQPYLVMTKEHAKGNDWRWFMGARTICWGVDLAGGERRRDRRAPKELKPTFPHTQTAMVPHSRCLPPNGFRS